MREIVNREGEKDDVGEMAEVICIFEKLEGMEIRVKRGVWFAMESNFYFLGCYYLLFKCSFSV